MDVTQTFLPVGVELIDNVFPTPIVYTRNEGATYDPATGQVTPSSTDFNINAGILSRARNEEGGTAETYSLTLWIQHSESGLPYLPTTADTVTYDGEIWKVNVISPTYSSAGLIASKIVARAS